jgi:hypothetical protein
MSKPSQVIVVLEDQHQRILLYRFLAKRGLKPHAITIRQSPSGEGSAEQWVRRAFVGEVREYRRRRQRAGTALVVVLDADRDTVHHRLRQLDTGLTENNEAAIDTAVEEVARLIPKRNIETWILCLNGHPVDEDTDYKPTRHDWNDQIPLAAEKLFLLTPPNAEMANCTDSLRHGITELRRLTF